jgi:hypothetical protein
MIRDYQLTTKALWFIVKRGRDEFDKLTEELENSGNDLIALGWKKNREIDCMKENLEKI